MLNYRVPASCWINSSRVQTSRFKHLHITYHSQLSSYHTTSRTASEEKNAKEETTKTKKPKNLSSKLQKKKAQQKIQADEILQFEPANLGRKKPIVPQKDVATLKHGLNRALFNPGVHWLKDPRSKVFNFDPRIAKVPQPEEVDMKQLSKFVKPSNDKTLVKMLDEDDRFNFAGSTSSLTRCLSNIWILLRGYDNPLNLDERLSRGFDTSKDGLTLAASAGLEAYVGLTKTEKDKYVIDSLKSFGYGIELAPILSQLGHVLESYLTNELKDFDKYRLEIDEDGNITKTSTAELEASESKGKEEEELHDHFSYGTSGDLLMRSQLDCTHPNLPKKIFDLKTRAVASIRYDLLNYEEGSGYEIVKEHGLFESFEREYYDLARSAFLKYSFQCRIGDMDGIFVAYHNTKRLFGFQYISLDEMDEVLCRSTETAQKMYRYSLAIFNEILNRIKNDYPLKEKICVLFKISRDATSLRCFVHTNADTAFVKGNPPEDLQIYRILFPSDQDARLRQITAGKPIDVGFTTIKNKEEIAREWNEVCKDRTLYNRLTLPENVSPEEFTKEIIEKYGSEQFPDQIDLGDALVDVKDLAFRSGLTRRAFTLRKIAKARSKRADDFIKEPIYVMEGDDPKRLHPEQAKEVLSYIKK